MRWLRFAVVVCLVAGFELLAQDASPREFEAVTVKPNGQKGPTTFSRWQLDPTFLRMTGYSLAACIERAYGLKPYQVEWKGAEWVKTERFDIEARTAAPATEREMMQMLQPVLRDQFHLVFRRETQQIPVLLLKVGPHGSKMKPASTDAGPNLGVKADHIDAFYLAMDDFADVLGQFVTDRPVLNRTDLSGEYQFHIEYAPKDGDDGAPSIFSALPDQLGLLVQGGKAPVEIYLIDKAERPSGN